MFLSEMIRKPRRAGLARLAWERFSDDSGMIMPHRQNGIIHLPNCPQAEFFPLKGRAQFVFKVPNDFARHDYGESGIYFGGTDEQPFLASLEEGPLEALLEGGEEAFYDYLVPPSIKKASQIFGAGYSRQGDIFAVPCPGLDWNLVELNHLIFSEEPEIHEEVKDHSVFGTRHTFNGLWLQAAGFRVEPGDGYEPDAVSSLELPSAFVDGVLTAPDHRPLEVRGAIHLVVQMEGLAGSRSDAE